MREHIQALRGANREIRAVLAEADERMNRVILAHFLTHEKELETEFRVFQTLRARLLWLFAKEEKGLIVRHLRDEPIGREAIDALRAEGEEIAGLFADLRVAANDYTPPADGCPTYDGMTENLATLNRLFEARRPVADTLYTNLTGGQNEKAD